MNYKIRVMLEEEYALLEDFLYESIFIPQGISAPDRSITKAPELQVYLTDFGKQKNDMALVAEVDQKVVGAVWVRIMNDFGHIDDDTPSLAISLYKEYRNSGIGTAMMKEILRQLKAKGYKQTSLSVQKANYALKMYRNVGYEIADENEEDYIMVCKL
jgi:ribosomal protein S18 acetylase RimI-like enzyme